MRFDRLDDRLKTVLALIGRCETLADVGCDHGFLSAAAVLTGAADHALASDISPVSARKAERLAKRLGISEKMTVICCDGLAAAAAEEPPYTIAVCGMGGELIARILEKNALAAARAERIVMQPMRGEAELREYLFKNGYGITDERVVKEGKRFYQVIAAVPNGDNTVPDWFPKDWFRFGWIAAEKHPGDLMPLLEHYRAVYARELEKARTRGKDPAPLVNEIERVDALMDAMKGRIYEA